MLSPGRARQQQVRGSGMQDEDPVLGTIPAVPLGLLDDRGLERTPGKENNEGSSPSEPYAT